MRYGWDYELTYGEQHGNGRHLGTQLIASINEVFGVYANAFVVSNSSTVAIFRLPDNLYGLFDSHARKSKGKTFLNGEAFLTMHASIRYLAHTIEFTCGGNDLICGTQYNIISFVVRSVVHRVVLPSNSQRQSGIVIETHTKKTVETYRTETKIERKK